MVIGKKGAIGAAMTWVVATIIIFFMIIIFIYVSFTLGKIKNIVNPKASIDEGRYSSISSEQMLLALLETEFDGRSLGLWILQSSFETSKEDFKSIKGSVDGIINKIPADKGKGWSLIINYPDYNYQDDPFSFGKKRISKVTASTLSAEVQGIQDCSIAYLGNTNVNLCQLGVSK